MDPETHERHLKITPATEPAHEGRGNWRAAGKMLTYRTNVIWCKKYIYIVINLTAIKAKKLLHKTHYIAPVSRKWSMLIF